MKRSQSLVFFILTTIGLLQTVRMQAQPAAVPAKRAAMSADKWQSDLKYLAAELPRRHKNAFHTVSKAQFELAVTELHAAIPTLQEHEILVGLRRIVAMIGDAHTELAPPLTFNRYPLTLSWFGSDLRVLRTTADYKQALGTRVVAVGGLPIAEVTSRVNTLVANENSQFLRYADVSLMPMAEVLHALKVTRETSHAEWSFENDKGEIITLDLRPAAMNAKIDWLSTLKQVPLYRQQASQLMWTTALPESKTVYLNLKVYPDAGTFERVSKEMFGLIDSRGATRLVVDVRQSNGGDFYKFRKHILKELKDRPAFRRPNSVFVIIGRGTVSAAMFNSIEMRNELGAVLVGEPSGSRPNSYSENNQMKLPNSGLELSFSSKYYKLQDTDTPSLMPDKLIEPGWQIYTAGRDAVMEWILAQPVPK